MTSLPPPEMPKFSGSFQDTLVPRRDGRAVIAFTCAILGFFMVPLLLGGTAIALGVQSRKRIDSSQGLLTGAGLAKAAVILGFLDVVLFLLLITQG
jgi:hypothetical protein